MGDSRATAWVALRVEVAAEVAEAVANFLIEEGAPGVVTEERDEGGRPAPEGRARLEAALPIAEHARVSAALARYVASLAEIHAAASDAVVESAPVAPIDWTAVYRRHHRPVATGRRLLVVPPWDEPQGAEGREVLVIEPGMAFGTGQHATTRACLEAIEAAVTGGGVASGLDVGTGSGILAVALARLGVPRVLALDVDPAVAPLARQNLARNRAAMVPVIVGSVHAVRGAFDLVVANLLADAIIAEAPALGAVVAAGGRLVLSGILAPQAAHVVDAFAGWRLAADRTDEGWVTLTLGRAT